MKIRIYKTGAISGETVDLNCSNARVNRELCGNDSVSFTVSSESFIEFQIGAAIKVASWMYQMNELPNYEKKSKYEHIFTFTFRSPIFDLEKIAFLDANLDSDFFYNGTAYQMLDLLFFNINRSNVSIPNSFTKGIAPDDEYKNIQFTNLNCLGALNLICQEFNLEYEHTQVYINLKAKVGNSNATVLEYGKGKGLYNIRRDNVDVDKMITRLYYQGSDKNLPSSYGYKRLHGSVVYLEKNISTYGLREGTVIFDEIKPHRTGIVSSFSIVDGEYLMVDSTMDFDLWLKNGDDTVYVIPGTAPKISFLTGDLAGMTFDLQDYDHVTQTFKLIPYIDEAGNYYPSAGIVPVMGNTYVIFDIRMPETTYLPLAVSELDGKAQDYLNEYCVPRVAYTLRADPKYFTENNISLNLGDTITINDTDLDISATCRIVSLEYPLFDPSDVTFKLSDIRFAVEGRKKAIEQAVIKKAVINSKLGHVFQQLRNKKTTNELKSAVFDYKDEYFIAENNRPESLDPYMLALDSGELQFSLKDIIVTPNSGGDKTKVAITAGTIIHHSINALARPEIEKKLAKSLPYEPEREWTIGATTLTLADDAKSYNLYAVIPTAEGQTTATIIADENHLWAKETANTIKYKLGFVSKVVDGERTACTLWGGGSKGLPAGTNGDILIYNNGWIVLTKGTDGNVLKLASGLPSWATESGLPAGTQGSILYHNGTSWVVLSKGDSGKVLSCSSTNPYWRAVGEMPSGQDGDTFYYNSGWQKLSKGTSGQILQIFNNAGHWVTRWVDAPCFWSSCTYGIKYSSNIGVGGDAESGIAGSFTSSNVAVKANGSCGGVQANANTGTGVNGVSSSGAGVRGASTSNVGVIGESSSSWGGYFRGLGVNIENGVLAINQSTVIDASGNVKSANGFTGTGTFTTLTIVDGIITDAE